MLANPLSGPPSQFPAPEQGHKRQVGKSLQNQPSQRSRRPAQSSEPWRQPAPLGLASQLPNPVRNYGCCLVGHFLRSKGSAQRICHTWPPSTATCVLLTRLDSRGNRGTLGLSPPLGLQDPPARPRKVPPQAIPYPSPAPTCSPACPPGWGSAEGQEFPRGTFSVTA